MIITREQQENLLHEYAKGKSIDECVAFVEGMQKAIELIDKLLKEKN